MAGGAEQVQRTSIVLRAPARRASRLFTVCRPPAPAARVAAGRPAAATRVCDPGRRVAPRLRKRWAHRPEEAPVPTPAAIRPRRRRRRRPRHRPRRRRRRRPRPPTPASPARRRSSSTPARHRMHLCRRGKAERTFAVALGSAASASSARATTARRSGGYPLGPPRASHDFHIFVPVAYPTPAQARLGFTGQRDRDPRPAARLRAAVRG